MALHKAAIRNAPQFKDLRIETVPVRKLKASRYNPREIKKPAMAGLRASVEKFGLVEPIVWNKRTLRVVGGHQRLKVLVDMGVERTQVVVVDLAEKDEKALNLALNNPGLQGNFTAAVGEIINELRLAMPELHAALRLDNIEVGSVKLKDGDVDPDDIPAPPDKALTRRGDLWVLGDHRLFCGDSGSPADVDRLLDGAKIQLVNTDPPYNVKVEPRSNNAIAAGLSSFPGGNTDPGRDVHRNPKSSVPTTKKMRAKDRPLKNDFLTDEAFATQLDAWFGNINRVLEPGRAFYIWGGYSNIANYPLALKRASLFFAQCIIWVKQHPVMTRKDFMGNHEWAFYGWREGAGHKFYGPDNATDVWTVKKVPSQKMVHLTEKPVELATIAIGYSTRPGEAVLDLFGGSGSTLIGCEQTGRRAFLMEMDELYCDVIARRFMNFTGSTKGMRLVRGGKEIAFRFADDQMDVKKA